MNQNITVGIIAEYNPFHKGHSYHIAQAKSACGARWCVAAVSGDFVQRGEPAIFDKYTRARMALTCGADLVVELPSVFAVSSAEDFAAAGTALLSRLGAVDCLCFGSEGGNIASLMEAASVLAGSSPYEEQWNRLLRQGLKKGLTWPEARNQALVQLADTQRDFPLSREEAESLLGSPNNLLGMEYCKALIRQSSTLKPVTIQRKGQGYHSPLLHENQASASALRACLLSKKEESLILKEILPHIPESLRELYENSRLLTPDDCSSLLNYCLLDLARRGDDLTAYSDLSPQLAARLKKQLLAFGTWEGRIRQLKTRQYTYTRISRVLTHILLGITHQLVQTGRSLGYAPYARVLGFRREALPLLSLIGQKSEIPLITKTADADTILSSEAMELFVMDLHASHVRQSLEAAKYGSSLRNEFTQPICIL